MTDRGGNLRVEKDSQKFLGDGQLEEANYLQRCTPYKSQQTYTKQMTNKPDLSGRAV